MYLDLASNMFLTTHLKQICHNSPSRTPLDPNQYSWGENYAGSSGLMSVSPDMNPMQRARSGTVSPHRKRRVIRYEHLLCPFFFFYFTPLLLSNF